MISPVLLAECYTVSFWANRQEKTKIIPAIKNSAKRIATHMTRRKRRAKAHATTKMVKA
jgi:hypothetical protein